MLINKPKKDNQIDALLKQTKIKKSLGESERNLRVKIKEGREGRIYTELERAEVFKPLSTSINKVLREGLFTKDAKGDFTIPRMGNQFITPSAISDATGSLMIEDDEYRLPEGFTIEEVDNKPVVVIDSIERIVNIFNDVKYKAGFLDLKNNSDNDNFMGVGDVNLKDFRNGLLTLSIDEDGTPLELPDKTKLDKLPMTQGLMSLFFSRGIIEKNGLSSVMTKDDINFYTQIIKEIINQNVSVRDEISKTAKYKSSLKYQFVLNKATINDIRNIPLERALSKEQRENTGMTQKEIDEVQEKFKKKPEELKKVFENAININKKLPSNKEFEDQKKYFISLVEKYKITGFMNKDGKRLDNGFAMQNYIEKIINTKEGKDELLQVMYYIMESAGVQATMSALRGWKFTDGNSMFSDDELTDLEFITTVKGIFEYINDIIADRKTKREIAEQTEKEKLEDEIKIKEEIIQKNLKLQEDLEPIVKPKIDAKALEIVSDNINGLLEEDLNESLESDALVILSAKTIDKVNKLHEIRKKLGYTGESYDDLTQEINEILKNPQRIINNPAIVQRIKALQEARGQLGYTGDDEPLTSTSGEGIKNKSTQINKNKSTQITINKEALKDGKMQVRNKNGHLLINRKCDKDTSDLIMKPFHHSKKYSAQSIKNYQDLMKLQGTPNDPKLLKLDSKTQGKTTTAPAIFTSPADMIDKLELIIGSKNAGNNSLTMINEGRAIIDTLLKGNLISNTEHEKMFKQYFNI